MQENTEVLQNAVEISERFKRIELKASHIGKSEHVRLAALRLAHVINEHVPKDPYGIYRKQKALDALEDVVMLCDRAIQERG